MGSEKILSIDPFADLDPMLNPENEKSDDYHLLAISTLTLINLKRCSIQQFNTMKVIPNSKKLIEGQ